MHPRRALFSHPAEERAGAAPSAGTLLLPRLPPPGCRAPRPLTVVGHGQHLVAGAAVVVDDGGGGAALRGQADLVGEGAAAAALDEGEPAPGAAAGRGGPAEVGAGAAGVEGVAVVGQHQHPRGRLQRRVLPVQAALARLPAAPVLVAAVLPRHVQPGGHHRRCRRPGGTLQRGGAEQRDQHQQRDPRRHPGTFRLRPRRRLKSPRPPRCTAPGGGAGPAPPPHGPTPPAPGNPRGVPGAAAAGTGAGTPSAAGTAGSPSPDLPAGQWVTTQVASQSVAHPDHLSEVKVPPDIASQGRWVTLQIASRKGGLPLSITSRHSG